MTQTLENPFRPADKRATKRLFRDGEKQKNISTKGLKEKMAGMLEQSKVKYGPHEIFVLQVQFLRKLEKLIPKEYFKIEIKTARQILAERTVVKEGNIVGLKFHAIGLKSLPPEISQLINLETFNCEYNQLKELPAEIGQLTNLRDLDCDGNQLSEIPAQIGQLINLVEFSCGRNNLRELPPEIGQLINLQKFNCALNGLRELPAQIGRLINLREFDCRRNLLRSLPAEIGRLINLKKLVCDGNLLHEPEMEKIRKLLPAECEIISQNS